MKKIILAILTLFLFACATQKGGREDSVPTDADRLWHGMRELSAISAPFRLQLSLRFGEEGNTRRVTAILWGNSDDLIRLDVMAGVGVVIAKIRDDGGNFLLFSPRDGKAYFYQGTRGPLLKLGIPLPFTLPRLAALLNGNYTGVFGNDFVSAKTSSDGSCLYSLADPPSTLRLSSNGLPEKWQDKNWQMSLKYGDSGGPAPSSIRLASNGGKIAILLVKEREGGIKPFEPGQLELAIPAHVPLLPLSQYKPY